MKDKKAIKRLENLYEAAGHVHVTTKGVELAEEERAALECGMSTALVIATELVKGEYDYMSPIELATRMKATATSVYVENVVLADEKEQATEEGGDHAEA